MRYSPESLEAFAQAAESGSFSAAARVLRKSQSTISTAVANLEADLGLKLFNRDSRTPVLTDDGQRVLTKVKAILHAAADLDELAIRLAGNVEPCLRLAISDFWQADHHESLLKRFAGRYPEIEFECMIAEDGDVIEMLRSGRVHIGVIRGQHAYPHDIISRRLQVQAKMAIFAHRDHPLADKESVTEQDLQAYRQLRLNVWSDKQPAAGGKTWLAPSYLLLLEMAEQGFGWSVLPRWLTLQFGHQLLKELPVAGWPQNIQVDVVWSRQAPPGPAGRWMIDQLVEQSPD